MALGVCLLFDVRAERLLRNLWNRLEDEGIRTLRSHTHRRHHPHLSYVVLLRWELVDVRSAVEARPDGGPFELTFDAVASFPRGRTGLVPTMTPDLLNRQRAVVDSVRATGALIHQHYETGRWLPHCSIAPRVRLDQLPSVAAAVHDILPLTVRIDRAALIESATGELWPLAVVP
jgi:hypothetical protein